MCSLAVPLNEGVESLVGEEIAFSVTAGLTVCTVNVRSWLKPGPLPNSLSCSATAVYVPSGSAGAAAPELQLPPVPDACASATGSPTAEPPANT